jgi:hypothetical protein
VILQSKYLLVRFITVGTWSQHPCSPPPPTAPRIIRVHIRTISTNAIHPLAEQSPLQIALPPSDRYTNFTRNVVMYFARETFVLYFCTFDKDRPYVQIWDWTTSDVIVVRHISHFSSFFRLLTDFLRIALSLSIDRSPPGSTNSVFSIPPTAFLLIGRALAQFGYTSSSDLLQPLTRRCISRRSISRPRPMTPSACSGSTLMRPPSRRTRARVTRSC